MIAFGNYRYLLYISLSGVLVLSLFLLYIYWRRRIISALDGKDGRISPMIKGSPVIARIKSVLMIISIGMFVIILLRPQWGENVRDVSSEGTDLVIALDVSRSMLARDIQPSRLERAKNAIRWIAGSLKGDRIGLILFAGDAFLQCPLTSDMGAFMMFLDGAAPDSINVQGTDIGRALAEAVKVFEKKRLTSRLLVLITDGEDHEGKVTEAAKKFKELGVSVYTLGIGRDTGTAIPADQDDRSGEIYYKDSKGKLIMTRRNPDLLKKLAGSTGGSYIDISDSLSGLKPLLDVIADQDKTKYGSRIIKEPREQFAVFALFLIVFLSLDLMLAERKR